MAVKITNLGIDKIQDNTVDAAKIIDNSVSISDLPSGTVVKYFKQIDETDRSFGTGWALGMTWNNFIKPAGTLIHFASTVPMRNDSTGWGGAYTRVEFSIDDGINWESLGDTGYDTVMEYGQSINHWNACQLIDLPAIVGATQVRFRYQHRSYDGTMTIRSSAGITDGPRYKFGQSQLTLLAIKV